MPKNVFVGSLAGLRREHGRNWGCHACAVLLPMSVFQYGQSRLPRVTFTTERTNGVKPVVRYLELSHALPHGSTAFR